MVIGRKWKEFVELFHGFKSLCKFLVWRIICLLLRSIFCLYSHWFIFGVGSSKRNILFALIIHKIRINLFHCLLLTLFILCTYKAHFRKLNLLMPLFLTISIGICELCEFVNVCYPLLIQFEYFHIRIFIIMHCGIQR